MKVDPVLKALFAAAGIVTILLAVPTVASAGPVVAPEIDPETISGAIALLGGGYLVTIARLRRK